MNLGLVWIHVAANLVWIGSILAVVVVLQSSGADDKTRGTLALAIYRRLAVPAFSISFLGGMIRLLLDTSGYLKQHHWMHPKLTVALVVIALHHVIGGRAKKIAAGEAAPSGALTGLAAGLFLCAVGAAFFAIFKVPD